MSDTIHHRKPGETWTRVVRGGRDYYQVATASGHVYVTPAIEVVDG